MLLACMFAEIAVQVYGFCQVTGGSDSETLLVKALLLRARALIFTCLAGKRYFKRS
jgi:hypothetical protein